MYNIKTLNNISSKGLERLSSNLFAVDEEGAQPDGILVRSAAMQDMALPENAEVRFRGERYRACRAETLVVADEALYVWGLLKKEGGDEPWTS